MQARPMLNFVFLIYNYSNMFVLMAMRNSYNLYLIFEKDNQIRGYCFTNCYIKSYQCNFSLAMYVNRK